MRTDLFLRVKEEVGAFSAESGDRYLVIEEDYRNGNSDIYGYDLLSHEEFQIIDLTLRIFYNFAKGSRILNSLNSQRYASPVRDSLRKKVIH